MPLDSTRPTFMARRYSMTYSSGDFVKLTLFRDSAGRARWVRALRATADYYGWSEEFEIWRPNGVFEADGKSFMHIPAVSTRGAAFGGRHLRICRSESRRGNPARLTNRITVSNSCRAIDLAELAHFTKGDWHWMESPGGQRITRDRWEEIYQAGGRSRSHVIGGALIR